jgi:hypothetical protein
MLSQSVWGWRVVHHGRVRAGRWAGAVSWGCAVAVAAVACTAPALGLDDGSILLGNVAGLWGDARAQTRPASVEGQSLKQIKYWLHCAVQFAAAALTAGGTRCN